MRGAAVGIEVERRGENDSDLRQGYLITHAMLLTCQNYFSDFKICLCYLKRRGPSQIQD